jgi:hypothetical protein
VIEDITVTDNDVVGVSSKGHGGGPRGLDIQVDHSGRTKGVTVTNNRTGQPAPGPVMHFVDVDGLKVDGNVQPLTSGELTAVGEPVGPLRILIYAGGLFIVLAVAGLLARRYVTASGRRPRSS